SGAAAPNGAAATSGGQPIASAATSKPAKRVRAIQRMKAHDPFVPVIHEDAHESGQSSTPTHASARSAAPTSAHPTSPTVLSPGSMPTSPTGVMTPAEPTAAVIQTNGKRQVVSTGQTFAVGDARFKLAAINRGAMRLQAADGSFTGGQRTI